MMKARDNPFSSRKVLEVRYSLQSITWEELMARLNALNRRAAIVGPEGSGKTTLLEDLANYFSTQLRTRWFSLYPDLTIPDFHAIEPKHLVFVDGADALNRVSWRQLLQIPCAGLIVTLHQPMHLPTLVECFTSPELLSEITAKLIGAESKQIQELSRALFVKHNGNLRDVLRELYDIWAARNQPLNSAGLT